MHYQDPAQLRAWALHLIATYTSSNHIEMMPGYVTNKPPPGIPTSGGLPHVGVTREHLSDGSYSPWYVALFWGYSDFVPSMSMYVGDTNLVLSGKRMTEWKPGMYFSSE